MSAADASMGMIKTPQRRGEDEGTSKNELQG
jgi:hypothetical protein